MKSKIKTVSQNEYLSMPLDDIVKTIEDRTLCVISEKGMVLFHSFEGLSCQNVISEVRPAVELLEGVVNNPYKLREKALDSYINNADSDFVMETNNASPYSSVRALIFRNKRTEKLGFAVTCVLK